MREMEQEATNESAIVTLIDITRDAMGAITRNLDDISRRLTSVERSLAEISSRDDAANSEAIAAAADMVRMIYHHVGADRYAESQPAEIESDPAARYALERLSAFGSEALSAMTLEDKQMFINRFYLEFQNRFSIAPSAIGSDEG